MQEIDYEAELNQAKSYQNSRFIPKEDILTHFHTPRNDPPRPAQIRILKKTQQAIKDGKKYIIIQAPTGIGKSALSYAILNYLRKGYICTSTKALQEQYLGDYEDLRKVRGRSNFICLEQLDLFNQKPGEKPKSCAECLCTLAAHECDRRPLTEHGSEDAYYCANVEGMKYWSDSVPPEDRCEYWVNKVEALRCYGNVHNYKYLITEANYIGDFTQRNVLISDEGHNIEDQIVSFIKLPITDTDLQKINKYTKRKVTFLPYIESENLDKKTERHSNWLIATSEEISSAIYNIKESKKDIIRQIENLDNAVRSLERTYEIGGISEEKYHKNKLDYNKVLNDRNLEYEAMNKDEIELDAMKKNKVEFVLDEMGTDLENWVVNENQFNGEIHKIEFQPVKIAKYAYDKYFRLGKINVIMSATILDHERLCKDLGIDLEEVEYIEEDPVFPVENHKIFNLSVANFSRVAGSDPMKHPDFGRGIVEKIDMILDMFPKERGIIHSTTYLIVKAIQMYSRHKNRLIIHNSFNREEKLKEHADTPGAVILSPSMTEGVNLTGELSRFQIIVKLPYPNLGEPCIKKRSELEPEIMDFKTALTLIQSIGRSVRTESDTATTFMLDNRIKWFSSKKPGMMKLYTRHVAGNDQLAKFVNERGHDMFFYQELITPVERPNFTQKKPAAKKKGQ